MKVTFDFVTFLKAMFIYEKTNDVNLRNSNFETNVSYIFYKALPYGYEMKCDYNVFFCV